jgi:lantibiotic leader peptide-processing serine protease
MKRMLVFSIIVLFLSTVVFSADWILESKTSKLPSNLETLLNSAGGTLIKSIDEVGVAVADFDTREEAEAMEAFGFNVMPDISLNWLPNTQSTSTVEHIGSNESYYGYQWHLPLIGADLAWDAGYVGTGARVAIVDSGIWYFHPDLATNIDLASGATFVPGTTDFLDDEGHGTHVAGIVAAADNSWGTIGVAPYATLIPVKVLASNGSGNISWIAAGIIHAANQNVDIINLSLGGAIRKSGYLPYYTARDAQYFIGLYRKALDYAKSMGALVIHSSGNDAHDMDHDGNIAILPIQAGNANGIGVSATGPLGLQDFYRLASYSNYGVSTIDVAAPGGDHANYPNPGWHLDMILSTAPSTTPGYYRWVFSAGTSMAAPVVSGVAALIVSKYGHMNPAQLKNKVIKSADDLGKPGADPIYGKGHVNAYEAIK